MVAEPVGAAGGGAEVGQADGELGDLGGHRQPEAYGVDLARHHRAGQPAAVVAQPVGGVEAGSQPGERIADRDVAFAADGAGVRRGQLVDPVVERHGRDHVVGSLAPAHHLAQVGVCRVEPGERPGELVGPAAHLGHDLGLGVGRETQPQVEQVVPGAGLVDPAAGWIIEHPLEQCGQGPGACRELRRRTEDVDRLHRHLDGRKPRRWVLVEQPPDEVEVPLVVGVGVVGDQAPVGPVAVGVPRLQQGVAEVHLAARPERNRAGQVGGEVPDQWDRARGAGEVVGTQGGGGVGPRVVGELPDPELGLLEPAVGDRPRVLAAQYVEVRVPRQDGRKVLGQVDHLDRKCRQAGGS